MEDLPDQAVRRDLHARGAHQAHALVFGECPLEVAARGVDIVKARALGAHGVLTGRATLFGVQAGGEAGALRALEILRTELERAMRLCGVRSIAEIGPELLFS